MHLTKENLSLHHVASKEEARHALTGIYVDPSARATAASDGRMLAVVTVPGDAPPQGAKPFILPAKVAQQIARDLGGDARVQVGYDKDKPVLTLVNGKKSRPLSFEPIGGKYPDYGRADLFAGKKKPVSVEIDMAYLQDVLKASCAGETVTITLSGKRVRFQSEPRDVTMIVGPSPEQDEGRAVTFRIDLLRHLLSAVVLGPSATLSMYEDRLRIESKNDEQSAKGVLMCCATPPPAQAQKQSPRVEQPASAPQPEAPKPKPEPAAKPQPKPAVAVESDPAPAPASRFRWWGKRRKSFTPKDVDPNKPPTELQRMLYTYLLRRHGEEITPENLRSTDCVGKIEELKSGLSFDRGFATWPQWKKVNYLLLERKAEPETVCEVLNGIKDVKTASEAISSWSRKPEPAAA